ncbi:MAG: hypothetical protein OCD02_17935 [Spirochaetaceae bacterium]
MNKHNISKLFLVLLVITINTNVFGSSNKEKEEDVKPHINEQPFNEQPLNNRLTSKGNTLLLPEDWVFILNPSEKGTLFNFRSPTGIEGGLECINVDYELDFDKLEDFYKTYVFKTDKKVRIDKIEHEKFGQITSFSGTKNDRTLYSLLFSQGDNVTFLHFSSPSDSRISNEEAFAILETYTKDSRDWVSVRDKKDAPLFSSINNTWFWYNDFKDGYYIALDNIIANDDMLAGIWTITKNEEEELKNSDDFDIKPFKYGLLIQNNIVTATVYGQKKNLNRSILYAVFQHNRKTYCFSLIQNVMKDNVDPISLIDNQVVKDIFDYHLLFTEDL